MERLPLLDSTSAPIAPAGVPEPPAPVIAVRDRRAPATLPGFDDLRELIVVVWARTQLVGRLLAASGLDDPRLRAGLADIDSAVAAIGSRLDDLEDTLPNFAD